MDVKLVDATPDDLPLVERWLHAEHVRRFWGEPATNARLLGEPPLGQRRAVIVADGRKVGLVVWQHPTRAELDEAGLLDVPETVVDLDILLGEPDVLGRGVGPEALRLVAARVLADPEVSFLIAAVMQANTSSRRAFEKAGFRQDRAFDDTVGGPCWLMTRHRPERWVRRMTTRDLERVAALSGQLGYPMTTEVLARRFAAVKARAEHEVFVCEVSGSVAGWTHVFEQQLLESEPYAEIGGLVVDAGHRRRGVGRALVEAARSWASGRGLGFLRVRSNVARVEAHQFYPGLGFTVLRTQHVYGMRLKP